MTYLLSLLAAVLLVPAAWATTFDVAPGPGTPLQDAIDAASPGDSLRLNGNFSERIVVDKALRIAANPSLFGYYATIDGGCTGTTVTVAADQVRLERVMVTGGSVIDIDVQGRNRFLLRRSAIVAACPTAEYGVNVYQSTRVKLVRTYVFPGSMTYGDAAIYIGGIIPAGSVQVVGSYIQDSVRGILLEDSPFSRINVRRNTVAAATDGIFLHNTQGAILANNDVEFSAQNGIWADVNSSDNFIRGNRISNSGNLDVLDDSNDNCWRGNTFQTGTDNQNAC